jgi:hypothetical protein
MSPTDASIELCLRLMRTLPWERRAALASMSALTDEMFPKLPAAMREDAAWAVAQISIALVNRFLQFTDGAGVPGNGE